MPNHYTTTIVFDKPMSKELKQFLNGLRDLKGGLCEALRPMPAIYQTTVSGYQTFTLPDGKKVEARSWYENPVTKEARLFTPEETAELKKLGASNWYDWANANWGTKWGTYDSDIRDARTWRFDSAWGPPYEVFFQMLCNKFDVRCKVYGRDEGESRDRSLGHYRAIPLAPEVPAEKPKAKKKKVVCPKAPSKKKK